MNVVGAERVPVQNLTLTIGNQNCTFYPNATEISGTLCGSILIVKESGVPFGWGYGYLWGYGLNTTAQYENATFGTGYGYGYNNSASYEMEYTVTWTTPDVTSNTAYNVTLLVNAQSGSNTHTYAKTEANFFTVQVVTISSSGGGGGGIRLQTETTKVSYIAPGSTGKFIYTDRDVAITEIDVKSKNAISKPSIRISETIKPFGSRIAITSTDGKIYKYLSITPTNFDQDDVDEITIKFEIPKSWFENNGLSPDSVVLTRYVNGKWEDLPTSRTGSKVAYYNFEATTPWFSTFAVIAEFGDTTPTALITPPTTVVPPVEPPEPEVEVVTPEPEEIPTEPEKKAVKVSKADLIILIVILVLIGLVIYLVLPFLSKKPKSKKHNTPLEKYVKEARKKGYKRHAVEKRLKESGWDDKTVDQHLDKHYRPPKLKSKEK